MLMQQAKKNRDHPGKRLIIQAVSRATPAPPAARPESAQAEPVKGAAPASNRP